MPLYMEDMVRPHKMDTILPSMTCEQKGEFSFDLYVFLSISYFTLYFISKKRATKPHPRNVVPQNGRVEPFAVYLLFLVLHSREKVPCPEYRFTQSLGRIISQKTSVTILAKEVMPQNVMLVIISKIASIQDVIKKHLPSICIHRCNHLVFLHSHDLM